MKLDEFIKQTLLDITNGVAAAQNETLLYIAPGFVEGERQVGAQSVKFEVGVTVSKEAKGGISVFSLGEAGAGASSQAVNKVMFEVPIYLQAPTERNDRHHSKQKKTDIPS